MKNTVTKKQIDDIFNKATVTEYVAFNKCLVVTTQLENGFIIVESSACVDPANFNLAIGRDICYERITNKLWELEGYKLQCEVSTQ